MQKRKLTVAMAVLLSTAQPGAAAVPDAQLLACAGMADSTARLACFDRLVAPLARQVAGPELPSNPAMRGPTLVAPPAPTAPARPASPPSAISAFGQEQLTPEQRPTPKAEELTLHARLTSQKPAGGGFINLYLDNGQVWRHQDQVLGAYLRDGDAVTIEKGALGSYKLSRDEGKSRNWIRVTRVR